MYSVNKETLLTLYSVNKEALMTLYSVNKETLLTLYSVNKETWVLSCKVVQQLFTAPNMRVTSSNTSRGPTPQTVDQNIALSHIVVFWEPWGDIRGPLAPKILKDL